MISDPEPVPEAANADPGTKWCIVNLGQLNEILRGVNCPACQGGLQLSTFGERFGFALKLRLSCVACNMTVEEGFSSPRQGTSSSFVINDLLTLFFTQAGKGHSAMQRFAAILNQKGLHLKTFQKKQAEVLDAYVSVADTVLRDSVAAVKAALQETGDSGDQDIYDVTVSYDGTWHKRGHTSLYGVGCVIEVTTGLIVDYAVLSKYCHSCAIHEKKFGADSPEYRRWYADHEEDCAINYQGSSNAMETEGARRLWARSVERNGLRYTGFLGDGDSKAFDAVVALAPYGETGIERQECVNHAHKRMGTALLNLTKQEKLGGRGYGRLTKDKAMYYQRMYRRAIVNNVGDCDGMRSAVWATLFHCLSTDDDPHHTRCPTGEDSWCFYQKAIATDEEPGPHTEHIHHPLDYPVAEAMVPVYKRMSDLNLMKRLAKGKTQNPNESFHSVIWSRCPKTVFVGYRKLWGSVAAAVGSFNKGAKALTLVMEELDIESNEVLNAHLAAIDAKRIHTAAQRGSNTAKLERTQKQAEKRLERAAQLCHEGPTYGPGLDQPEL